MKSENKMSIYEAAISYHEEGIRVLPVTKLGSGDLMVALPKVKGARWVEKDSNGTLRAKWSVFREHQTREEVEQLFKGQPYGIAIITGIVGLEAIDMDCKYDLTGTLKDDYADALKLFDVDRKKLFEKIAVEKTKSDGLHFIYRCDNPMANSKLAGRPASEQELKVNENETRKYIIETRGEGGLLYVAPTPGYEWLNFDITQCGKLTDEERSVLIDAAILFDDPDLDTDIHKDRQRPEPRTETDDDRPGDKYDRSATASTLCDLLDRQGYKYLFNRGSKAYYQRPGKKGRGISCSVLPATAGMPPVMYVFSSNMPFPQMMKAYLPFQCLAFLKHNGDFGEAAKELAGMNNVQRNLPRPAPRSYNTGDKATASQKKRHTEPEQPVHGKLPAWDAPTPEMFKRLKESMLNRYKKGRLTPRHTCLYFENPYDGLTYDLAGQREVVVIKGMEKTGKTFVMTCIAASQFSQTAIIGYKLKAKGKILWLDTEQNMADFDRTIHRICQMGKYDYDKNNLIAYPLEMMYFEEACYALEYYLINHPEVEVVFLDGVIDLIRNFNSLQQSQDLVKFLKRLRIEHNILLVTGIHLNKSDGTIRGHFGALLMQKGEVAIKLAKSPGFKANKTFSVEFFNQRSGPPLPDYGFIRNDFEQASQFSLYPTVVTTEEGELQSRIEQSVKSIETSNETTDNWSHVHDEEPLDDDVYIDDDELPF